MGNIVQSKVLPSFSQQTKVFKMNKFTLLNSNGVARPGFYIEITEFPQGSQPGKAIYVDGRGEDDMINFKFNPETELLDAWHIGSPNSKFTMRPITVTGR